MRPRIPFPTSPCPPTTPSSIGCFRNEIASTVSLFRSLPADQLDYRPHAVSRSAREIVVHLPTYLVDMAVIPHATVGEETLTYVVSDPADTSCAG